MASLAGPHAVLAPGARQHVRDDWATMTFFAMNVTTIGNERWEQT